MATLEQSLADLAVNLVNGVVNLIIVFVFFSIGYIVAWVVTSIVRRLMDEFDVENKIAKQGITPTFGRFTLTSIINFFLTVYIVLALLGQAAQVTNLVFLQQVVTDILTYVPQLIQGLVVLIAGLMFARYLSDIIREHEDLAMGDAIAIVLKLFIGYSSLVIALPLILPQIQITILSSAFEFFIGSLAIAFGLGTAIALGWGLKDSVAHAAKKNQTVIDQLFEGMTEKRRKRTAKRRRKH